MHLPSSGNKLSNLTFYDLKQLYTQAKNYALNISEIEAKVREATNDDPWCVFYVSSALRPQGRELYVDAGDRSGYVQLVCSWRDARRVMVKQMFRMTNDVP